MSGQAVSQSNGKTGVWPGRSAKILLVRMLELDVWKEVLRDAIVPPRVGLRIQEVVTVFLLSVWWQLRHDESHPISQRRR